MKIKTQAYNNAVVVELHGDFISDYTKDFCDGVAKSITSEVIGVVLDMTHVGFIDSEGLEQLLWCRDYCHENTRQLKIAGLDDNCAKILEITRLLGQFDSYVELAGAVKSFA